MRTVDLLKRLEAYNPWWEDPGAIDDDKDIIEWSSSRIRWRPGILDKFDLEHDSVYTLRGARQVGKTTAMKILARTLLGGGVDPWDVMYYACDDVGDRMVLGDTLRDYLAKKQRRPGQRRFMLIDEISSVRDWQKSIKSLWDMGKLRGCSIIATGSHAIDVRMAAERLPGRRGEIDDAMDKVMYPMKFYDYVRVKERGADGTIADMFGGDASVQKQALDTALRGAVPKQLLDMGPGDIGRLNRHLLDYMLTGGIPKIVEANVRGGRINERLYVSYLNTFLSDLERLDRSRKAVKDVLEGVIDSIGWPVSWTSLMKKSDINGASTVPRYIELLEDMFVISVLYQYDSKKKRAVWKKSKKIHFVDPFYFHMFNGWRLNVDSYYQATKMLDDAANQGRMAEGIVANHMVRMAFDRSAKKPWFDHTLYLHFWKYESSKEVDFVYNDGYGIEVPIEVKFKAGTCKRDLDGLINFKKRTGAKGGLILTRDELAAEYECVKMPVALFLMLV